MKKNNKQILYVSIILNVFLILFLIFSVYQLQKVRSSESIKGFYTYDKDNERIIELKKVSNIPLSEKI